MNKREGEKNGDDAETADGVEATEQGQTEKKEEIAASENVSTAKAWYRGRNAKNVRVSECRK